MLIEFSLPQQFDWKWNKTNISTRFVRWALCENLIPLCHDHSHTRNWAERSSCNWRSNLHRPLFLVIFLPSFTHPIINLPEGVVLGFWNFAWAPNSQKYEDSNQTIISGQLRLRLSLATRLAACKLCKPRLLTSCCIPTKHIFQVWFQLVAYQLPNKCVVLDQIIIILTQHQVELGLSLAIEFGVERRDKQNILGGGTFHRQTYWWTNWHTKVPSEVVPSLELLTETYIITWRPMYGYKLDLDGKSLKYVPQLRDCEKDCSGSRNLFFAGLTQKPFLFPLSISFKFGFNWLNISCQIHVWCWIK